MKEINDYQKIPRKSKQNEDVELVGKLIGK
jgi:hypothetical protein